MLPGLKSCRVAIGSQVNRIAKSKDGPKYKAQKKQANGESLILSKTFGEHVGQPYDVNNIHKRYEHHQEPPAGFAGDLKHNINIVEGNNTGPAWLTSFFIYFPMRNDQEYAESQA